MDTTVHCDGSEHGRPERLALCGAVRLCENEAHSLIAGQGAGEDLDPGVAGVAGSEDTASTGATEAMSAGRRACRGRAQQQQQQQQQQRAMRE